MQAHSQPDRNRMNYRSVADAIAKSFKYEGNWGLLCGYYSFYISTLLYATLTIGITNSFTESWKRKKGLK